MVWAKGDGGGGGRSICAKCASRGGLRGVGHTVWAKGEGEGEGRGSHSGLCRGCHETGGE